MLKIRKRNGRTEYFLSVKNSSGGLLYHDFFSTKELQVLPECTISLPTLWARLAYKKKSANSRFKSLWDIVTVTNSNSTHRIKVAQVAGCNDEFIRLMKVWPAGSLAKNALIMQSVRVN